MVKRTLIYIYIYFIIIILPLSMIYIYINVSLSMIYIFVILYLQVISYIQYIEQVLWSTVFSFTFVSLIYTVHFIIYCINPFLSFYLWNLILYIHHTDCMYSHPNLHHYSLGLLLFLDISTVIYYWQKFASFARPMHLKMLDMWVCCKLEHISQMKTFPAALLFIAVSLKV